MDNSEYILKEREFLHDISNQLVVAQASASYLKRSLSPAENQLTEKHEEKLSRLNSSIEKILESLKTRKKFVSEHR